jgi:adenosylcobyric acid synthase
VGTAYGHRVTAYEIHHGHVIPDPDAGGDAPGGALAAEPFLDGWRVGDVWGTTWHGALENDGFRRAFLAEVARRAGRDFAPHPDTSFAGLRERRLDALADLVERHLDTGALLRLIEHGPPADLPPLPPGAPATD